MSEDFKDFLVDSQLRIETTGRNDKYSDSHHYPYEPTAYSVLDHLIETKLLSKEDVLLDYGCGMGRVPIYLREMVGCRGYGIELVKHFYKIACRNKASYKNGKDVEYILGKAETYEVPLDVTACFFFNPFDLGILRGVIKQILDSYYMKPRKIRLFFYYPQDEYIDFLLAMPELEFEDDIDCEGSKAREDRRNRIAVFYLP